MRMLPVPADVSAAAFAACVRGLPSRRDEFEPFAETVAEADERYREAAEAGTYRELTPEKYTLDADMTELYETGMVKRAAGRKIYEAIKAAADECPLCGRPDVTTLDHYLSKSSHNAFAVNPANLVPACDPCNRAKGEKQSRVLHLYYDHLAERERWLHAEIRPEPSGRPPAVTFTVRPPDHWPDELIERVHNHFGIFQLGILYRKWASGHLTSMRYNLVDSRESGSAAVRRLLERSAQGDLRKGINSWQVTLFTALAASDWFCDQGCLFGATDQREPLVPLPGEASESGAA